MNEATTTNVTAGPSIVTARALFEEPEQARHRPSPQYELPSLDDDALDAIDTVEKLYMPVDHEGDLNPVGGDDLGTTSPRKRSASPLEGHSKRARTTEIPNLDELSQVCQHRVDVLWACFTSGLDKVIGFFGNSIRTKDFLSNFVRLVRAEGEYQGEVIEFSVEMPTLADWEMGIEGPELVGVYRSKQTFPEE
jgi:hypothetical protein